MAVSCLISLAGDRRVQPSLAHFYAVGIILSHAVIGRHAPEALLI